MQSAGQAVQDREPSTPLVGASLRQAATPWAVLLALAALAWVVTVQQARGMGVGVGTMGMAFPFFLAMWVAMMGAMMFPSVAPIAILWTRSIANRSAGWERGMRTASFVAGYFQPGPEVTVHIERNERADTGLHLK